MKSNLINLLLTEGSINQAQAELVTSKMMQDSLPASFALIATNVISSQNLAKRLTTLLNERIHDISAYPYESICKKINQPEIVLNHQVLPLFINQNILTVAVSDPTDISPQEEMGFATGLHINPVLVETQPLAGAIRKIYGHKAQLNNDKSSAISDDDLLPLAETETALFKDDLSAEEAPVSRYIQQILFDAVRKQASDIHFEPFEHNYQIRFRLDGILQTHNTPPVGISRRLSTRLKILAKLNIAERRLPQDGRIKLNLSETTAIDMRVSTLPTLWGEKVVLRILDGGSVALDIDSLGYNEQQKQAYLAALDRPQGMILMTGPTGSGKTVSLYTGLKYLNTTERNIATAEDPVEINLPGINQVNINSDIGLSFAKALRAFLRQDPDVVMVGEIRDLETAEIGIKAAQTGHLVLSTLHTNSAAESITRLANMGVAPYNLAASLSLIVAQRLARRLCSHCKQPHPIDDHQLTALATRYPSLNASCVYQASPDGCDHCNNGYLGRVGIYEVMPVNSEIADAITRGDSSAQIAAIAKQGGMLNLQQAGIEKMNEGVTSLIELQRVISL